MHIRVLGPLEVSVDDRSVALGGSKQRAILAMLGLEANQPVTAERLIDGLWGEAPPASAPKMVQNYVWRLRGVLAEAGGAEILTRGRAYELRIDPELVDVHRLERLVPEAARAAEANETSNAAREALALFHGDPLADVADEPFATPVIRRLEELRLTASELAIDADLAAGRHQEIVVEVDALLADNPLRERLHAQRMLGLYRCGRQAEALEAYRDARTTLVEEIGVEPRPELRRLHDAILRQDPALDLEPAATQVPAELDASASPPLIGRDGELRRLRARWQRAAAGTGTLVTLVGASGMGKTRVAAEIAGDAHREGAAVLYTSGAGPPEAVLALIARARGMRSPVLVVIDDADRAPAEARAALRELGPAIATRRCSCSPPGRRRRGSRGSSLPNRWCSSHSTPTACGRSRASTPRPATRRRSRWTRCWPRATASRVASTRPPANGRAVRRPAASTPWPLAPPPAARRRRPWSPNWPAASSSCRPPASASTCSRATGPTLRGLPVQGPRDV